MIFSIIIPTYNSGTTIKTAIESILSQTFTDFEILIIDGLSKDDTTSKIQEFEDSRIKIVSEKDNGVYDAMNKGIRLSKGEWLYFLGSDDILYENTTLERLSCIIRITESKIIYGNVLVVGNAGWAKDGQIYDGYFSKFRIISKNICHQSIFYHRDVFKFVGLYNTKYQICGDHDFNIRASSKFKYQFIDLIIAKFYGGGKSHLPDLLFIRNYDKIIIKNHLKILHLININNRNILKSAYSAFKAKQKSLSLYLVLLYIYKVTFVKFFLKIKTLL